MDTVLVIFLNWSNDVRQLKDISVKIGSANSLTSDISGAALSIQDRWSFISPGISLITLDVNGVVPFKVTLDALIQSFEKAELIYWKNKINQIGTLLGRDLLGNSIQKVAEDASTSGVNYLTTAGNSIVDWFDDLQNQFPGIAISNSGTFLQDWFVNYTKNDIARFIYEISPNRKIDDNDTLGEIMSNGISELFMRLVSFTPIQGSCDGNVICSGVGVPLTGLYSSSQNNKVYFYHDGAAFDGTTIASRFAIVPAHFKHKIVISFVVGTGAALGGGHLIQLLNNSGAAPASSIRTRPAGASNPSIYAAGGASEIFIRSYDFGGGTIAHYPRVSWVWADFNQTIKKYTLSFVVECPVGDLRLALPASTHLGAGQSQIYEIEHVAFIDADPGQIRLIVHGEADYSAGAELSDYLGVLSSGYVSKWFSSSTRSILKEILAYNIDLAPNQNGTIWTNLYQFYLTLTDGGDSLVYDDFRSALFDLDWWFTNSRTPIAVPYNGAPAIRSISVNSLKALYSHYVQNLIVYLIMMSVDSKYKIKLSSEFTKVLGE
jgi:hypothetical protein